MYIEEEIIESGKVWKEIKIFSENGLLIKWSIIGYEENIIYDNIYEYDQKDRIIDYSNFLFGFKFNGKWKYFYKEDEELCYLSISFDKNNNEIVRFENEKGGDFIKTNCYKRGVFIGYILNDLDLVMINCYDANGEIFNELDTNDEIFDLSIYD